MSPTHHAGTHSGFAHQGTGPGIQEFSMPKATIADGPVDPPHTQIIPCLSTGTSTPPVFSSATLLRGVNS